MRIEDILALKNEGNTWDEVFQGLDYEKEKGTKTVSLKIKKGEAVEEITAGSYDELTQKMKLKSDEIKKNLQEEVALELTGEEYDKYKGMGFNEHEMKNAIRLSKKSGVGIEQILSDKKGGQSWESLIEKYSYEEGAVVN